MTNPKSPPDAVERVRAHIAWLLGHAPDSPYAHTNAGDPTLGDDLTALLSQLDKLETENERLRMPPPDDEEAAVLKEIYGWTSSAYLAGEERGAIEEDRKRDLYVFLCRLIGWFTPSSDPRSHSRLANAAKTWRGNYISERAARQSAQASNASLVGALRKISALYTGTALGPAGKIARQALSTLESGELAADNNVERDALRYRRLQVLGCAPDTSPQLENGTVLRWSGLDDFVDADLKLTPSRGEFKAADNNRKGAETAIKRTMTINLTEEEMAALEKLSAEQDLKPPTVFRQALRVYQLYCLPEDHPERIGRPASYGADRLSPSRSPVGGEAETPMEEFRRRLKRHTGNASSVAADIASGVLPAPVQGDNEAQPNITGTTAAVIKGSALQGDVAGLVEKLDKAILGLNPLTGYGEDAVWRPADRARTALIEARDRLSALAAPPSPSKADVGALVAAATRLLKACHEDFGVPDENDEDDEAVGASLEGPCAVKFGHMRGLSSALASFRASHDGDQ